MELVQMTEIIVASFVKKLLTHGFITEGSKDIVAYGLELLISSIIGLLLISLISAAGGYWTAWISFIIGFAPLRYTAGGYHAKSHMGCYFAFSVAYALCFLSALFLSLPDYWPVITTTVSFLILLILSPVAPSNKPLSEHRRRHNRHCSVLVICLDLVASVCYYKMLLQSVFVNMFFLGIFAAAVSLIAAQVINGRGNTNEKK